MVKLIYKIDGKWLHTIVEEFTAEDVVSDDGQTMPVQHESKCTECYEELDIECGVASNRILPGSPRCLHYEGVTPKWALGDAMTTIGRIPFDEDELRARIRKDCTPPDILPVKIYKRLFKAKAKHD